VKKQLARYSLRRSGWHRFWFLMLAIAGVVSLAAILRPTAAERYAIYAKELKVCKERCRPKVGVIESREKSSKEKIMSSRPGLTPPPECICK
jgi:hypothetical protein